MKCKHIISEIYTDMFGEKDYWYCMKCKTMFTDKQIEIYLLKELEKEELKCKQNKMN